MGGGGIVSSQAVATGRRFTTHSLKKNAFLYLDEYITIFLELCLVYTGEVSACSLAAPKCAWDTPDGAFRWWLPRTAHVQAEELLSCTRSGACLREDRCRIFIFGESVSSVYGPLRAERELPLLFFCSPSVPTEAGGEGALPTRAKGFPGSIENPS